MCGFAGIINFKGLSEKNIRPSLLRAGERLKPRGPDSSNIWLDNKCALVNTRLAIQDLSETANLPMAKGNLVIAYNGEIYNFKLLKKELQSLGHKFTTNGDTEVVLEGWKAWGIQLLDKLSGMFAFVIWNSSTGKAFFARDRFGKKPLLLLQQEGRITFGSDLVALESLLDYTPEINLAALNLYFSLRWVPEPLSISQGIQKLPAGSFGRFDESGLDIKHWYNLSDKRGDQIQNLNLARNHLVETFDNAVECRMTSDVPIGVFLSGGIDSALVAASMKRVTPNVESFTVGFEGASSYYEERPEAKKVANFLGTKHAELVISAKDTSNALMGVFDSLDEPFADSSAVPTYLLSKEVQKNVSVVLTGDGADEIFGGYRKYQGELVSAYYRKIPSILRQFIIEPLVATLPETKSNSISERIRLLRRFMKHAGKDSIGRHVGWLQAMDSCELKRLMINKEISYSPDLRSLILDCRASSKDNDPINAMLYGDLVLGLVSDMLVKVDRTTMGTSLEARSPFLDNRIVEMAAAMPSSYKLRNGMGKWILRNAFSDRLPSSVFSNRKKGFEVPIAEWLTGPLEDLTRQAIDPNRLKKQGLFDPTLPAIWYKDLENRRKDTSEKLWMLVAFQGWCKKFRPNLSI